MKKKLALSIFLFITFTSQYIFSQGGRSCDASEIATIGNNIADNSGFTDQWFMYTATISGTITLSTCGLTTENTNVKVYNECGGSLITYNDDICNSQSAVTFSTTLGETYYFRWMPTFTSTSYTFSLTENENEPGDECSNALVANSGDNTFTGTQNQIKWYSYTATQNGKLTISACANTSDFIDIRFYTNCNSYEIGAGIDCDGREKVLDITQSQTYYISIANLDSSSPFDFSVTESPYSDGDICSMPIATTAGNNYTFTGIQYQPKWYSYTATQDGKLIISACGNTSDFINIKAKQDCSSSWLSASIDCDRKTRVFDITEGQTYYISIINYDSPSPFDFSVTESLNSVGDICSNPIITTAGNNYTFTGIQSQIKWYSYTATQNGKLTISACNNTSDYIEVNALQDCNNNEIEPRSTSCDGREKVFDITEGQTYYISITNLHSSSPFDFSVTESPYSDGDICSNPISDSNYGWK
jgi:hypothetical protein